MVLLFLLGAAARLAAPNRGDARFVLSQLCFLGLPGLLLCFVGWRSRRGTPVRPPWLHALLPCSTSVLPWPPRR